MSSYGTNDSEGVATPEASDNPAVDPEVIDPEDTIPPGEGPTGPEAEEGSASESEPKQEPKSKPSPPPRTMADILREQLEEKERQLHEYIAAYKEAKRDMDGRLERVRRDRAKMIDRDRKQLATALLAVLDNLDRSVASMTDATATEGLKMVHGQFADVLTEFGVERMEVLGVTFDANLHEAIGMVPAHGDQRDQQIVHVDRAGYLFKGELLRAAKVVVATAP